MSKAIKLLAKTPFLWACRPKGLYVFNYHRIGDPSSTPFDPNVFSCDVETFDKHLSFYEKHFTLLTLEQLQQKLQTQSLEDDRYACITFDDGYIDNYQSAFPLLNARGIPASFFVATDFIAQNTVPWWDEIAYLVKACLANSIDLSSLLKISSLVIDDPSLCIKQVLNSVKHDDSTTLENVLETLRNAVNSANSLEQVKQAPLFMDWTMLAEMQTAGMEIGSQTRTHRILAQLDKSEQSEEISHALAEIDAHLPVNQRFFAYPVGGKDSFNQDTISLLQHHGYPFAFSFMGGINKNDCDVFQLRRFSVDGNCSTTALKKRVLEASIALFLA
ncbi:polysaccharide deacetylase family protein [Thalassotalea agarivorans]|uniref:Polysaccharide deacetylase n=1 Tax=Thalassotalea agarivorans TaxID=349064 RepID=A0A1I0DWT7_THASX|nr:polysaccharide deacetylase family protein [Thalassotalea agarivorans]SET37160.1 Polysaccharide deacetylase [Thalassotalea agarivorans]